MRQQGIFIGVLLIALGLFFFFDSFKWPFLDPLYRWPTILLVIGIGFLFQAAFSHENCSVFPGILLLGLGFHFHALYFFSFWPASWGMYTMIVAIAFLIQYQQTRKGGLWIGLILLLISLLKLFYAGFQHWIDTSVGLIQGFWPLLFIALGVYFLVSKK